MAAWDPENVISHGTDFRLVHNSFVTLFWSTAVLDATTTDLRSLGYDVIQIDTAGWASAADMHADLAASLNFPDYYGRNLAALNDCIGDVAAARYGLRSSTKGLVLVLVHFERFAATDAQAANAVLDTFARQARVAALLGNRMMCLVQTTDPRLTIDPVGATPVVWNDAEWSDASRGL